MCVCVGGGGGGGAPKAESHINSIAILAGVSYSQRSSVISRCPTTSPDSVIVRHNPYLLHKTANARFVGTPTFLNI